MKTNMLQKTLMFVLLAGTLTGIISCKNDNKQTTGTETDKIEKVSVLKLVQQPIANSFELTSTLIANEEVYFAPASPGRIDKILVDVGSHFKEGDVLFTMDKTQLTQAKIQMKNLEVDMARFDTLIKTGNIPKQQYDQMKTQYEVAKTNVKFLEDNNQMRAPFGGVVAAKFFQNGEIYSGAPNTQAGKAAVLQLVQINPLKALISITESKFPIIKPGMQVQIKSDIYSDMSISGKIIKIYPTIDMASRTFQIEVSVPNPKELLRPGMFCRAIFEVGQIDALVVPSIAVMKLQGSDERYVFIEKDGVAKRITVKIGKRFDDKVELISPDIHEGDNLITSGQARLVDGTKVEVVK